MLELEAAGGMGAAENPDRRRFLPFLPLVLEQLKLYEGRRSRFPTLEKFYPTLLAAFVKRARGGVPDGKRPGPRPVRPASSACGGAR